MIFLGVSQHASQFEGERNLENAELSIAQLIVDAGLEPSEIMCNYQGYDDGYFKYKLHRWLRVCNVSMPGLPIERVKFTGLSNHSIWDFPRLYVDGSSWVWQYAVNRLRERFAKVDLLEGAE